MWEIIKKNKIKSAAALSVMAFGFMLIFGSAFSILLIIVSLYIVSGFGKQYLIFIDITIGFTLAICLFVCKVLSIQKMPYPIVKCNLYKTDKFSERTLYNQVEEMTTASGLKKVPDIYVLDSNMPNAYACGLTIENSSIVVTKGLLELLTKDELQGVIAHEISHIVNRDTMYLLCSGAMYILFSNAVNDVVKIKNYSITNIFDKKIFRLFQLFIIAVFIYIITTCSIFPDGSISIIEYIILFVAIYMAGSIFGQFCLDTPVLIAKIQHFICSVLFFFISRSREYLADACACRYTRYPKGLANALLKIENANKQSEVSVKNINNLVKASFTVPLNEKTPFGVLFSTHPATENRIKILMSMTSADYLEYEKQYRNIKHEKLIPESALKNSEKLEIKQSQEKIIPVDIASACALNEKIQNKEQIKTIKQNKDLIKENIQKHRNVEDFVRNLANYKVISCDCGTKLKIPHIYKNKIIICPHCNKKHLCS